MGYPNIKSKLALGTVQFGLDYGISNTGGKTPEDEVRKLLDYAWGNGIKVLDTALAYGDAEAVVGRCVPTPFRIVSKFPAGITTAGELELALHNSLTNLRQEVLYGYIAHNAKDFVDNEPLWKAAVELRASGRIQKIGYSLYSPGELDQLLDAGMLPDLVQLPFNILDNKFEHHLDILKQYNVEVHVRSVFLQGLFFMESFPEKLQPLAGPVAEVKRIAESHSLTMTQLLLNYALHHPAIGAVVMGVNNLAQLKCNINDILEQFPFEQIVQEVKRIEITEKNLLNPVNWK